MAEHGWNSSAVNVSRNKIFNKWTILCDENNQWVVQLFVAYEKCVCNQKHSQEIRKNRACNFSAELSKWRPTCACLVSWSESVEFGECNSYFLTATCLFMSCLCSRNTPTSIIAIWWNHFSDSSCYWAVSNEDDLDLVSLAQKLHSFLSDSISRSDSASVGKSPTLDTSIQSEY